MEKTKVQRHERQYTTLALASLANQQIHCYDQRIDDYGMVCEGKPIQYIATIQSPSDPPGPSRSIVRRKFRSGTEITRDVVICLYPISASWFSVAFFQ